MALLALLPACTSSQPGGTGVQELCPEATDPALIEALEAALEMSPFDELSKVQFMTAAADAGIESLAGVECASGLEQVNLSGNSITDLSPLTTLPLLDNIHLNENPLSDLSPLSGHQSMFTLKIADCQVDSATAIVDMPRLANLDLTGNPLSNLDGGLTGLGSLQTLRIDRTQVSDLAALDGLSSVRLLTASETQLGDLASLPTLPGLADLVVSDALIQDASFANPQPALTTLDLSGNQLTDIQGLVVSELPSLAGLNLSRNPLADLGLVSEFDGLQRLTINEVGLSDLSGLEEAGLTALTARGNGVADLTPAAGVRDLDLGDNSIVDVSPLVGQSAKRSLDLSNNQIDDLSPLLTVEFEYCAVVNIDDNPDPDLADIAEQLCSQNVEVVGNCIPLDCDPCPPDAEHCG